MRLILIFICLLTYPAILSAKPKEAVAPAIDLFRDEDESEILKPEDLKRKFEGLYQAINKEPYNYVNYVSLAILYDQIGDIESELEAMRHAVAYLPEDAPEKDLLYGILASVFMLNGQWEQGKEWLDQADAVNPGNDSNRWSAIAYYLQYKKDYPAAALELKKLDEIYNFERDPYYEAYLNDWGDPEEGRAAVELFRETVKAEPDNFKTHRMLGIAIRNQKTENYQAQFSQVMQSLNKAYELNPRYVPTLITIANTYMYLELLSKTEGGYKIAAQWLEKAYALEPDNINTASIHGILLIYMGSYDEAIMKMESVYARDKENGSVRSFLASAYNAKAYRCYESGEYLDTGLTLVDKALALEPQNGIFLSTKAELFYKLGRFEEAYTLIKESIKLEPDQEEIQKDLKMIEEALKSGSHPQEALLNQPAEGK